MVSIGELVHLDEQAEFRSDVQLSAYDKPSSNLALLRSYMFGSVARQDDRSATPSKSPVDILELLVQAYSHELLDNRFVVIANYGHGKSHLALALANYFGKPDHCQELQILYEKLNNALGNSPKAQRYRAFKDIRGRFLVIPLRGDVRRSLREQFTLGLEKALNEHEETRGTKLPFWFDQAATFLENLKGPEREQANDFLAQYQTEVSILLQDVLERNEAAHQRCIELFKHLYHGVAPNFGSGIAIKEAIAWTVENFCGDGKPFGGILVLFDEFSLYIQDYAKRGAPGELQDLLNGIDDHRGQAAFLAFAQHDPIVVAREVYQLGQGQTHVESLERELTRLQQKFSLYSVLESVIDSYLLQREERWNHFVQDNRVRGPLTRATDVTLDVFKKRYENELNWMTEDVYEVLTKGCFPLHPLTTALLCNLKFQGNSAHLGVARTVLGFVHGELKSRMFLAAAKEDLDTYINWAMPTRLVEYYGETLSPSHYQQYKNALQAIAEEPTFEQEAALSALLLQEVAGINRRGHEQIELLAELSGISEKKLRKTLRELSATQAILYVEYQKKYTFWSLGNDPHKLDSILARYLEGQEVDWSLLAQASEDHLKPVSVPVDWGHTQDWRAISYFLTKDLFTPEHLRELVPSFAYHGKEGFVEGERGAVFWLLARNQAEVEWFKECAAAELDNAFPGQAPLPVVAVIPEHPAPNLLIAWQRMSALRRMTQDERKEVGLELHTNEVERARKAVSDELRNLQIGGDWERWRRPNHRFIVPTAYRSVVRALNDCNLSKVLENCYGLAYQASPPEFFNQLKENSTHLRTAVKHLANLLRQNSAIEKNRLPQGIARDLAQKFLRDRWALLDSGGHVCVPLNARVKRAWDYLEEHFVAGKETSVRDVLIPLFNPPFGYDYHTATLLFCAWFGFHHHDLQLTVDGRRVSAETLDSWLGKHSKDFINRICHVTNATLERRDREKIDKEASLYIERAVKTLSQEEAEEIAEWLFEYSKDRNNNQALHAQALETSEQLKRALEAAREYDRQAEAIESQIETGHRNLTTLMGLQAKISNLPVTDNVRHEGPTAELLRQQWLERVEQVVEQQCADLAHLSNLTQVELHKQRLKDIKKQLQKAGMSGTVVEHADNAIAAIEEEAELLRLREQETGLRQAINAMNRSASLQGLYDYRVQLAQMKECSTETAQLRDRKLAEIEEEITQLEELGKELPEAASRLSSLEDVRVWENAYLGSIARFEESPFFEPLHEAYREIESLSAFLEAIDQVNKTPVSTPQEARQVQQQLDELRRQVAGHAGKLAAIDEVEGAFRERLRAETLKAERWLSALEARLRDGDSPVRLKQELEWSRPKLLQPAARERLAALQKEVQAKLDADIIAKLEADFRQISDATLRHQCLERLAQVHAELNGVRV